MTTDIDFNRLNELLFIAEKKLDKGDYEEAKKIAMKMGDLGKHPIISYMRSGILIDLGSITSNAKLVLASIKDLENNLDMLVKNPDFNIVHSTFYNMANGFYILFKFKRLENPLYGYFEISELDRAIEYYQKAIEVEINDSKQLSMTWTNLGNCFDFTGRVIDALECYEKALTHFPEHGMAMANKGVGYFYYSKLVGEHSGTFLYEAYHLISNALKLGVNLEAKDYFLNTLNSIKNLLPKKNLNSNMNFPGYKIESDSDFEKFLIKFCLKNKLYLNICNFCQKCDAAIGDSLTIPRMTITRKESKINNNQYFKFASKLNHIKQDFITSRFLVILSRYQGINLDFVDKRVKIIDTLDFTSHNIYISLIKTAFKSFYDILDKIAVFINEYLELGLKINKINFRTIWYKNIKEKEIRDEIKEIENYSLNAIFSIFRDFEEGRIKKLKEFRHTITHRFMEIGIINDRKTEEVVNKDALFEYTITLAKVVRNVIIYLMHFVNAEENKKLHKLNYELP